MFYRVKSGLCSRNNLDFLVNIGDMDLNSIETYAEFYGNFLVAFALANKPKNFNFASA